MRTAHSGVGSSGELPSSTPTSHISLFRSDTVPHWSRCSRPRPLEAGRSLPHSHGVQLFPAPRPTAGAIACAHPGSLSRPRFAQVARVRRQPLGGFQ
jgi:hypothetical protein